MPLQAGSPTRRHLLTWLLAGMLLLVLGVPVTRAEMADLAKAAAWRLGDQLSLAGLLYAQGNQADKVEQLLTSLKPLAGALEAEISPSRRAPPPSPRPMPISSTFSSRATARRPDSRSPKNSALPPAPSTKSRSSPISCFCCTSRATIRASAG